MAKLLRCTDRYAHIELHIPRDLWEKLLDRHFTQGAALGTVRTASLNAINARLIDLAMQDLEAARNAPCDSEGEARPF